jgi:UDP-N-acetylglucosamine 2-epimerase (non-hydrolysing)
MKMSSISKKKILTIFGTRPEAIKMAPLIKELKNYEEFITYVCVTAQHRQLLDQVLDIFNIQPDFDLDIMKHGQSLTEITIRVLERLDQIIQSVKPDLILVHGDTTTTFTASLAGFYNKIAVGHIEAGLRTNTKYSPFPEEINRQLTSRIADLHFAPTEMAAENLRRENILKETIFVTGNTVIDAQRMTITQDYNHIILEKTLGLRLVLLTAHRRENLGKTMRGMFKAIRKLTENHKDIAFVFPVHPNPKVTKTAVEILGNHPRILMIDPLDTVDFHNIMARSYLVLTDSGGVQEEATALGIPVLVLRNTTERQEGMAAGNLKLTGISEQSIFTFANELLTDSCAYSKMSKANSPYGDGQASRRIAEAILYYFKYRVGRPDPYIST